LNRNGVNSNFIAEEAMLENLVLDIKNNEPSLKFSELAKSIFYHVSIIKTVKRAIENNTADCNCAPVPFYFADKSPFLCQEDLVYNVSHLKTILNDNISSINQMFSIETIQSVENYLNSATENTKLFKEIYFDLEGSSYTESDIDDILDDDINAACANGLGTAPGCCGNYSGCCWLTSSACLIHDLACWCCDGWYCGWQCDSGGGC
jgi:hypothetical protein